MGACAESYEALNKVNREAWAAVPQDYIDNLIRGMINRVKAKFRRPRDLVRVW
jgi:hypothetical protein